MDIKELNKFITKPTLNVYEATALTNKSIEWRKNLKVGDQAICICVLDKTGRPYHNSFFSKVKAVSHRKVIIISVKNCGPCPYCNKSIGILDTITQEEFHPSCFGYSSIDFMFHCLQPVEYQQSKILIFNGTKNGN